MIYHRARERDTGPQDAAAFYEGRTGRRAAEAIRRQIARLLPAPWTRRMLGIGFPGPYLPTDRPGRAELAVCARLSRPQTMRPFPGTRHDCVIDGARLPFDDLSFDAVLMVHALELSPDPAGLLRAAWKAMADDGILVLVVPNRAGFWAHGDRTPFGHGTPYSGGQIRRLLADGFLRVERHEGALALPPALFGRLPAPLAAAPERLARLSRYPCAGAHLLTARKDLYAGTPAAAPEGLISAALISAGRVPRKRFPAAHP